MDMRVLAVHTSESFLELVKKRVEPVCQLRCCYDGETALAELDEFQPDALVLHMCLPGKDGLTLLEQTPYTPPVILAIMDWADEHLALRLQNMGVTGILNTPSVNTLVACLLRQLEEMPTFLPVLSVRQVLHSLGFRPSLTGYCQLCLAMELLEQDPRQALNYELYPAIAKALNFSDGRSVEKTIRKAIQTAWTEGNRHVWRRYFLGSSCPSNREFLMGLLEQNRNWPAHDHAVLLDGTFHG